MLRPPPKSTPPDQPFSHTARFGSHSHRPPSVYGAGREHIMDQASREAALRRIEAGLDRLAALVGGLPHGGVEADMVSREAHETLLAAHQLLRTRAEAAVAGIDRLLNGGAH